MKTKIKKSVVLSILMILTMSFFTILTVNASDTGTLTVSNPKANIGETVDVDISIKNNPGLVGMTLDVDFDSSVMELVKVTDSGLLGTNYHKPELESPYTLSWSNDTMTSNIIKNGKIATLSFLIKDKAVKGKKYPITISYDYENYDIYDCDINPIKFTLQSGSISIPKDSHVHTLTEIAAKNSTCTVQGNNKYYYCSGCGKYFKDSGAKTETTVEAEKLPLIAHNYTEKATSKYRKSKATCTHKAVYYKSCSVCGEKSTETFESGSLAEHIIADEWFSDTNNHWHKCTVCNAQVDKAKHSSSDWITDKVATETEKGSRHKECTVCKRVLNTEEIPMLDVQVKKVTLDKTTLTIEKGKTAKISATVTPTNATDKTLSWTSSDESIATVTNGKVTAVNKGTVKITAKAVNGKSAVCTVTVQEPPESVTLNKNALILGVGEEFTFQAKVPDGSFEGKLEYSSNNTDIATIQQNGVMQAKSKGTAIITVKTYNGKTAKCRVTVKNAPTKISINRANSIMGLGETFYLEGSLANDEASRVLTFSSNKPEVATVTDGGIVTAKSIGTAIVSITTYNGQKATCRVTVRNAPQNVYFNKTEITLGEGQTFYLESQFNTNEYARTVVYNSKNKSIATISGSGVIMAKSVGTATITGKTYNGKTATCIVTVKKAPTSVKLNKSSLNMKVGQTETLKTTLSPSSSATGYVWKSSDKSIVTVNSDGTMVAKKVGTATITVKTHNGKNADCIVTVKI